MKSNLTGVNLSVIDDGSSDQIESSPAKKMINKISKLSNGFARLIVCEELKDERIPKPVSSQTKSDQVNTYLNGLESVVVSFKASKAGHNETLTSSDSSSSSIFDSKKNLIIPASMQFVASLSQPAQQTSICALSTSSSSCISDEGCYGSSDFSSEKDAQLKQQRQQQYKKLNLPNNHKPAYPTSNTPNSHQQNFYINNLSRFEKIYNELGVSHPVASNTEDRISPYLVKPSVESSDSSILSSGLSPNVQIVASISGSYV